MDRSFTITVGTAQVNLYTAICAITGAIPASGILPDRGNYLEIQAASGNGSNTITVSDFNNANTSGKVLYGGDVFDRTSNRNSICFRDFNLIASAAGQSVIVSLGSI